MSVLYSFWKETTANLEEHALTVETLRYLLSDEFQERMASWTEEFKSAMVALSVWHDIMRWGLDQIGILVIEGGPRLMFSVYYFRLVRLQLQMSPLCSGS